MAYFPWKGPQHLRRPILDLSPNGRLHLISHPAGWRSTFLLWPHRWELVYLGGVSLSGRKWKEYCFHGACSAIRPASLSWAHTSHWGVWQEKSGLSTKMYTDIHANESQLYVDVVNLLEVSLGRACCNVEVFPAACAKIYPKTCCQTPGPGHPEETTQSHGPQRGWNTRCIVHSCHSIKGERRSF